MMAGRPSGKNLTTSAPAGTSEAQRRPSLALQPFAWAGLQILPVAAASADRVAVVPPPLPGLHRTAPFRVSEYDQRSRISVIALDAAIHQAQGQVGLLAADPSISTELQAALDLSDLEVPLPPCLANPAAITAAAATAAAPPAAPSGRPSGRPGSRGDSQRGAAGGNERGHAIADEAPGTVMAERQSEPLQGEPACAAVEPGAPPVSGGAGPSGADGAAGAAAGGPRNVGTAGAMCGGVEPAAQLPPEQGPGGRSAKRRRVMPARFRGGGAAAAQHEPLQDSEQQRGPMGAAVPQVSEAAAGGPPGVLPAASHFGEGAAGGSGIDVPAVAGSVRSELRRQAPDQSVPGTQAHHHQQQQQQHRRPPCAEPTAAAGRQYMASWWGELQAASAQLESLRAVLRSQRGSGGGGGGGGGQGQGQGRGGAEGEDAATLAAGEEQPQAGPAGEHGEDWVAQELALGERARDRRLAGEDAEGSHRAGKGGRLSSRRAAAARGAGAGGAAAAAAAAAGRAAGPYGAYGTAGEGSEEGPDDEERTPGKVRGTEQRSAAAADGDDGAGSQPAADDSGDAESGTFAAAAAAQERIRLAVGGPAPLPLPRSQTRGRGRGRGRGQGQRRADAAAAAEAALGLPAGTEERGGETVELLDPTMLGEVVLWVVVCAPGQPHVLHEEFLVLGSNLLSELRDCLGCATEDAMREVAAVAQPPAAPAAGGSAAGRGKRGRAGGPGGLRGGRHAGRGRGRGRRGGDGGGDVAVEDGGDDGGAAAPVEAAADGALGAASLEAGGGHQGSGGVPAGGAAGGAARTLPAAMTAPDSDAAQGHGSGSGSGGLSSADGRPAAETAGGLGAPAQDGAAPAAAPTESGAPGPSEPGGAAAGGPERSAVLLPPSHGSYLFTEGRFYCDVRHPDAEDYTAPIRALCRQHGVWPTYLKPDRGWRPALVCASRAATLEPAAMHLTRFEDLTVRQANHPIGLFCHRACCEHVMFVRDVRRWHPSDPPSRAAFPLRLRARDRAGVPVARRRCGLCEARFAELVTHDDPLAPSNPFIMCRHCFDLLHVGRNGQRIAPQVVVQPYNPALDIASQSVWAPSGGTWSTPAAGQSQG